MRRRQTVGGRVEAEERLEASALEAAGPFRRASADASMAAVALHRAAGVLRVRDHPLAMFAATLASAALELDRWATGRAWTAECEARKPPAAEDALR